MKKILLLALLAISTVAMAQTDKETAKAQKAQKAADLKAFKEKQKAELAAFVEKQKNPSTVNEEFTKAQLLNKADSVAYLFGVVQSNGLKQYAQTQLGVDTTNINDFARGILENVNTDNDPVKKAYAAGSNIASQIIQMAKSFSNDYFAAEPDKKMDASIIANGLIAGLLEKSNYRPADASQELQNVMEKRQAENKEALYGANREAGEKWLEENKTKDGVVTLPSGLQYKIITKGNGATPKTTDKVSVNYEGKLIDGTVFDSSYQRGKPTSFGVNQVIKGWTEALTLMPVGSKWEVYIPYQLAYGDRETGREIKPYSALIFTVELLDIETKEGAVKETTVNKVAKNSKTAAKK